MTIGSQTHTNNINQLYFLQGGGEMGELIRKKDWAATSLGPPQNWPQPLQTMVKVMLDNPFGMYIAWGKDYLQLYNDAYRPILGTNKHPHALGISTHQTFAEAWQVIEPLFAEAMSGKGVGFPDFVLQLNRHGYVEECYFDFSYSPIRLADGQVGGILVTVLETTNKKVAEIALKQSEVRFRTMADNIAQLAWMADAHGSIFWYNKRWYEFTGLTFNDVRGWEWKKIHHPEHRERVVKKFEYSMEKGQPWEDTFPLKGADGLYKWFLSRAYPIKNEAGKVLQWFGTNTDITTQIETEQALKESEQRFRTMAEATDVLISVTDDKGNSVYYNKAWVNFSGFDVAELIGEGWSKMIIEENRNEYVESFRTLFAERKSFGGEFQALNKDKQLRWMYSQSTPRLNPDGSFAGFISSCIDITERKEADWRLQEKERNLRNTILQAPVAMCLLKGKDYVVDLANDRMFELWGRSPQQMLHKPLFEGLTEIANQGFEEQLAQVFFTGQPFYGNEVPITLLRYGQPQLMYINYVCEPFKETPDGEVAGIFSVGVDVTPQVIARLKIEEVVAQRTKALEEVNNDLLKSNEELAQFAYIASHDLQEPLRKITTFSQMLENNLGSEVDQKGKNYLDKINNATRRMSNLINDVLLYSQVVKDNQIFVNVDLNDIVKNVIDDYELLIEQKDAVITVAQLPIVQAIPLQMTQLFGNILGNALKFSRSDKKPRITIEATQATNVEIKQHGLDDTIDYFKILIADNGIGFKKEYADQIFNIFQRLHRNSEYEGTGIGLAICKKIVLNHGGVLTARGSTEAGAIFNIILPKHKLQLPSATT